MPTALRVLAPDDTPRRLRPEPTRTDLAFLPVAGRLVTAVMRHWAPGSTGRCGRCPICTAREDSCLVLVGRHVPPGEAPTLSLHGLTWTDPWEMRRALSDEPARPPRNPHQDGACRAQDAPITIASPVTPRRD